MLATAGRSVASRQVIRVRAVIAGAPDRPKELSCGIRGRSARSLHWREDEVRDDHSVVRIDGPPRHDRRGANRRARPYLVNSEDRRFVEDGVAPSGARRLEHIAEGWTEQVE